MVCPGYITHYYSWRVVHGMLCLVGLIGFTTFYTIFPETSQPGARGIDKMNAANGIDSSSSSSSFIFINPLEPLWLLRSPSMLLTVRFFLFFLLRYDIERNSETKFADSIQKGFNSIYITDGYFRWDYFLSSLNLFCESAVLIMCVHLVISVPLPYTIVRALFSQPHVVESKSKLTSFFCCEKGRRYHITNEALIGACFLPGGFGSMSSFVY